MPGRVAIVGAGPGPADLLTVRAAAALRAAQVVLYDDLVSVEVLGLCPSSAELIYVGKRRGKRGSSQEQINALMIQHARKNRAVVRLKSGDPAVFGRLGEELDALREAGIPFEIIPGITAAAAAASAAELTLTDRRAASTLVVLTAHSARGNLRPQPALDLERTTFAVYMPGPDYAKTARELVEMGIDAATPCAVVSNACRGEQKVRLITLAGLGSARGIIAPAVLIVGRVAGRQQFAESLLFLEKTHDAIGNRIENPAYQ
ncbi:MAG TPA: uroporphyrinogen-III C-methyltransferase [Candidatus Angelobacter sp.]